MIQQTAQFRPEIPAGFALSPMNRATIFVRDLDASLALYRDLLGLQPMFDNFWDNEGINAIMNTEGRTLRAVVLRSGESVVGNLGVYQLDSASPAVPHPPVHATTMMVGDVAVVFTTNAIDRLTDEITAAGYPVISPPVVLRHNPAYAVQAREMAFRDPDGVIVNLVQSAVERA